PWFSDCAAITIERVSAKPVGWLQRKAVTNKSSPFFDPQKGHASPRTGWPFLFSAKQSRSLFF
ncbi:MAG: hypothetical protein ACRBB6_15085, partial [Neptuniibacter sp.]